MNMKVVSMCLICAGALLTGCGNGGKKEAETSERKEKEARSRRRNNILFE